MLDLTAQHGTPPPTSSLSSPPFSSTNPTTPPPDPFSSLPSSLCPLGSPGLLKHLLLNTPSGEDLEVVLELCKYQQYELEADLWKQKLFEAVNYHVRRLLLLQAEAKNLQDLNLPTLLAQQQLQQQLLQHHLHQPLPPLPLPLDLPQRRPPPFPPPPRPISYYPFPSSSSSSSSSFSPPTILSALSSLISSASSASRLSPSPSLPSPLPSSPSPLPSSPSSCPSTPSPPSVVHAIPSLLISRLPSPLLVPSSPPSPPLLEQAVKRKKKRFPCTVEGCIQTLASRYSLRRHLKTHEGVKPYSCTWSGGCDRKFAQRSTLTRHLRVHTGPKPFRCKCGKGFVEQNNLIKHKQLKPWCNDPTITE